MPLQNLVSKPQGERRLTEVRKTGGIQVGVVVAVLSLALMAGPARAAMWIGLEVGPSFATNTDFKTSEPPEPGETIFGKSSAPSVLAGITVGYDFINQGFLGDDWSKRAKYFDFAVDFSYNALYFPRPTRTVSEGGVCAVEPGIRFMATKSISLTAACRYRYTQLNFVLGGAYRPDENLKLNANLLSLILRAAYHF